MFRRRVSSSSRKAFAAALPSGAASTTHPVRALSSVTGIIINNSINGIADAYNQQQQHRRVCGFHCNSDGDLVVSVVLGGANGAAVTRPPPTALFRSSRPLLAPTRGGSSNNGNIDDALATTPPLSPYETSIESVLTPDPSATLKSLVALLIDPAAAGVEEGVTVLAYATMIPRRRLAALGGNAEWVELIAQSEQLQSAMDARALRLEGILTVGRWDEAPDRAPVSAYSRGLLQQEYRRSVRLSSNNSSSSSGCRSSGDGDGEVLAWLTRAIHKAVAEEFAAAGGNGGPGLSLTAGGGGGDGDGDGDRGKKHQRLHMVVNGGTLEGGTPRTDRHPPTPGAEVDDIKVIARSAAAMHDADANDADVAEAEGDEEEVDADGNEEQDADVNEEQELSAAATATDAIPAAASVVAMEAATVAATDEAEFARMLAEVEEMEAEHLAVTKEPAKAKTAAAAADMSEAAAPARKGGKKPAAPAEVVEEEVGEDEEIIEEEVVEEEEVDEEEAAPTAVAASAAKKNPAAAAAAAVAEPALAEDEEVVDEEEVDEEAAAVAAPTSAPTPSTPADVKLTRLAELMLTQFNSADGYLHRNNRTELIADEKAGYVTLGGGGGAGEEDATAQVDPLALFSAYHNAKIPVTAPVAVRAIKQVWNGFNAHQMLMEDAAADDAVEEHFHKQKSVDALVHGALMMRAISREEEVLLGHSALLPAYGFPVLSSDTRTHAAMRTLIDENDGQPFATDDPIAHTDLSFMSVEVATRAYKTFFANKEACRTPFRPRIDANAGCGVVMLSGTTLHLYDTSLKTRVTEEQVRPHFAEAMLGVLHVAKNKILPRVNTVHYHIMVTVLPNAHGNVSKNDDDDSDGYGSGITAPTTLYSLDLTTPFTAAEKARLLVLADPLGLPADQVSEFHCVEDIVMEIDDATGVTVVHDLQQSRDDLEALLTPTLVELLPDDMGTVPPAATSNTTATNGNDKNSKKVNHDDDDDVEAVAVSSGKPAAKKSAKAAAAKDEAAVEVHEEEEEEPPAPIKGRPLPPVPRRSYAPLLKGKRTTATPTPTATTTKPVRKSPAAAAGKTDDFADEEEAQLYRELMDAEAEGEEAEEMEEEVEEEEEEMMAPPTRRGAAHGKRGATVATPPPPPPPASRRAAAAAAARVEVEEDEEEYEDEEVDEEEEIEVVPLPKRKPHHQQQQRSAAAGSRRAHHPPAVVEADDEEEEYEEADDEEEAPPARRKQQQQRGAAVSSSSSGSIRRAHPPPAVEDEDEEEYEDEEVDDDDEEEEAEEAPAVVTRRPAAAPAPKGKQQQQQQQTTTRHQPPPPPPPAADDDDDDDDDDGYEEEEVVAVPARRPAAAATVSVKSGRHRLLSKRRAAPVVEDDGDGYGEDDEAPEAEVVAVAKQADWVTKSKRTPKRKFFS